MLLLMQIGMKKFTTFCSMSDIATTLTFEVSQELKQALIDAEMSLVIEYDLDGLVESRSVSYAFTSGFSTVARVTNNDVACCWWQIEVGPFTWAPFYPPSADVCAVLIKAIEIVKGTEAHFETLAAQERISHELSQKSDKADG